MEATNTLHTEHNSVLYVLDEVEQAASAAASGQAVPKDVFTDVEEFFRVFVDRCHHSKEEMVLFPRLTSNALPRALEAQHTEGRQLAQAYATATASYVPGDEATGVALARATGNYAAMLRGHIASENAELLPTIERELAGQDRELVDGFESVETDRIGSGTHERLHGMIETLVGRIAPFLATAAAPAGSARRQDWKPAKDVRQALPEHPVPEGARQATGRQELRIDGLVEEASTVRPADLAGLARVDMVDTFECEEGWQVQHLTWRGVRLWDVLGLGRTRPEARYVRVSSGGYAVPLPLADAERALLAEALNGQPLSLEHGGPWRLVMPGAVCFTSVKWVDHLQLTLEPGEDSGQAIARARLSKGD